MNQQYRTSQVGKYRIEFIIRDCKLMNRQHRYIKEGYIQYDTWYIYIHIMKILKKCNLLFKCILHY